MAGVMPRKDADIMKAYPFCFCLVMIGWIEHRNRQIISYRTFCHIS